MKVPASHSASSDRGEDPCHYQGGGVEVQDAHVVSVLTVCMGVGGCYHLAKMYISVAQYISVAH